MYDIIIVGAGPAGSTLAHKLAVLGFSVLIIEKQAWPRFKPCAGGITKRCYNRIATDISKVVEDTTYSMVLTLHHRIGAEITATSPLIYQVDRKKFDAVLSDIAVKSGAEFHVREKFLDFEHHEGYISVKTEKDSYMCRVLVGADGVNSTVARKAGFTKFKVGTALEAEVRPKSHTIEDLKGKIHIDFGTIKAGYGWNFPKKDSLSIGVGTFRNMAKDIRDSLHHMLDSEEINDNDEVHVYGHPLAFPHGEKRRYNKGNILLVGDAAGLADPFTGEGIYYAVWSASIASEVISGWFNGKGNLDAYTKRINKEIRPEIRSAYELSVFCYHFFPFVMLNLKNFPVIFSYFADVITGHDDFRYWQVKVPSCMFGIRKPQSKVDIKYIK